MSENKVEDKKEIVKKENTNKIEEKVTETKKSKTSTKILLAIIVILIVTIFCIWYYVYMLHQKKIDVSNELTVKQDIINGLQETKEN